MGAVQNSMLHLISSTGVATHAIGGLASKSASSEANEKIKQNQTPISEANDADKNEMMAEKAKLNAYKLQTARMKARTERRNARLNDMKSKEEMKNYKDSLKKEGDK